MLEDAEVDWDVADLQKVQQRARIVTGMATSLCLPLEVFACRLLPIPLAVWGGGSCNV